MNGAEHYIEAERLLKLSDKAAYNSAEGAQVYATQAQVHATLALIAGVNLQFTAAASMQALADLVTE